MLYQLSYDHHEERNHLYAIFRKKEKKYFGLEMRGIAELVITRGYEGIHLADFACFFSFEHRGLGPNPVGVAAAADAGNSFEIQTAGLLFLGRIALTHPSTLIELPRRL